MTKGQSAALLWTPRIAALAVALFLSLFALDAFNANSIVEALVGFAIHLLPALAVLAMLWLAWRFPLAGAGGFVLLAIGYGFMIHWRRLDWIVAISGPLVIIAVLFLASWIFRATSRA